LQRELLDDRYGDGLSGRQIAEKSGRNVEAVFQSLHRAREALLHCIEQGMASKDKPQ
jgi:DNA-directed RNA polymerase specialized sigma24 family protein